MHSRSVIPSLHIRDILSHETPPYELLLEADPSRQQIERYLKSGTCRIALADKIIAGICISGKCAPDTWEIFSLCVEERFRRKGIARELIWDAEKTAEASGARNMEIGTANSSFSQLRLYQSCGYRIVSIIADFFLENYDEPIFENGLQCTDMVRLRKRIFPGQAQSCRGLS